MIRIRSRYTLLASLLTLTQFAQAQIAPEVPRMVVNILVDQLRSDYLQAFSPLYGEGGFVRLMNEGKTYTQAEYPFAEPDRASSSACFYTGASPYENGIVGRRWLNRQTLTPIFCVDDAQQTGIRTNEKVSPQHLGVSTLGDEVKVSTEGASLVYSVSPFSDICVMGAGHAGDGAFWLDDNTGSWCSSSYYLQSEPKWLEAYENQQGLVDRINSITWKPLNDLVGNFNYFLAEGQRKPFQHRFTGERKFRQLKASACVNDEVLRFVEHLMKFTSLGVDGAADMLNVTLYAGSFDHQSVNEFGMEMQDTYARLDRTIEDLISLVERRTGKGKALFVLTSTGYTDPEGKQDLGKYRIPTGTFSITRAKLLLNMYLIAVYGSGQYVETALDNELYLNLKLIENRNLNLSEVLERSCDFLIQLAGVRDVYSSQRLIHSADIPGANRLRNAYNPKCSGDILVKVQPGWTILNEDTHEESLVRESYMPFPLFIMGPGVPCEKVRVPISIDQVAPTLAQMLRIRAPNACHQAPLNY